MSLNKRLQLTIASSLLFVTMHVTAQTPVLTDGPQTTQRPYLPGEPGNARPVVLDVVLHEREKIINMLRRAEELTAVPNPANRPQKITLILHGPEIEFFQISHYEKNRDIVDLAAKLDAFNIIDVKICNTKMSIMGIEKKDIPAFVEIVPYGPAEIERLQSKGFIKL